MLSSVQLPFWRRLLRLLALPVMAFGAWAFIVLIVWLVVFVLVSLSTLLLFSSWNWQFSALLAVLPALWAGMECIVEGFFRGLWWVLKTSVRRSDE